jgi:mRNA-degrading endonuclease RelE of RelBE toxin-antitoxin system
MYRVKLTPSAGLMFNNFHPTIKKQLKSILRELYEDPYLGKKLQDELAGFRSLKMKRYRAIYQIEIQRKEVIIYAIGHRKNIYEIVANLL